ncbi:MAG TPA: tetratricopeptide repeat protein [Blastocatellia bacterium]|nr:tetratricopeptide repeat protein [Blastocatellia bacterium]
MRFRILPTVLALLLVAISVRASDWDRSVALYQKGEYRAALAEFQDIVIERPDVAGAWYYIGLCEFKLKHYERVELPMMHAIDLLGVQTPDSPDVGGAWYTIGISEYLLGKYDRAIEPLKRYLELATKNGREIDASARTALGRSYFFLDKYDEAAPLLSTTARDGDSARQADQLKERATNNYYLGAIYFKREDDDRAITELREATRVSTPDAASLELLAESLMRKARKLGTAAAGKPDPGAGYWTEAADTGEKLRTIRDDIKTEGICGRAYLGARQFDKAAAPLEKVARANPDNAQAWLYYGIALSRGGQLRKAMEALEITIQLAPDSLPAFAELGYVYESDKQYQQALRIYEKAFSATNDPSMKERIDRVKVLAGQP